MNTKLELPHFEKTPQTLELAVTALIESSKKRVQEIGEQELKAVSFESTVGALDHLNWQEGMLISRVHLLHNVSVDEALRKAAQNAIVKFQDYSIERVYDPKVYAVVKAYEAKNEKLQGEREKLLNEMIRDFKRLGLDLPNDKQTELKKLQKELSEIETHFSSAINEYHDEITVTTAELDGLDEDFSKNLKKTSDGKFKISLQYPEYLPAMEFAKNEKIRRELLIKKYNTARDVNSPRLLRMVQLRRQIAQALGYSSWNDYVIEERMAKRPENVLKFIDEIETRLKSKAESEHQALFSRRSRSRRACARKGRPSAAALLGGQSGADFRKISETSRQKIGLRL